MVTGRIKTDAKLVRIGTDLKLLKGFEFGEAMIRHGKIPAAFLAKSASLAGSFTPEQETVQSSIQIPFQSITDTSDSFVSSLPRQFAKSMQAMTKVTSSLSSMAIRGAKWFIEPFVQMADASAYGTSFNMVLGGDLKKSSTEVDGDAEDRLEAILDNGFRPGVGEDFDDIRKTRTPEALMATLGFDMEGDWILGLEVDNVGPDIFENMDMHTLHHLNKAHDNPNEMIGVSGHGDMVPGGQAIPYQVIELGINATDGLRLTIDLMNEGLSHALSAQIKSSDNDTVWRQAEEILVKNIERAKGYIEEYARAERHVDR